MNILLTGMPASGKTTAAEALGRLLKNYKLIDTDKEIIRLAGLSINEIFEKYGAEYFRKLETEVLRDILNNDGQIISSGGGIILSDENIRLIKEKAVSIYLKIDIETLLERALKSSERPLLNGNFSSAANADESRKAEIKIKLENLFKVRSARYEKADIIINTKGLTPEETADVIRNKIDEYNKRKN